MYVYSYIIIHNNKMSQTKEMSKITTEPKSIKSGIFLNSHSWTLGVKPGTTTHIHGKTMCTVDGMFLQAPRPSRHPTQTVEAPKANLLAATLKSLSFPVHSAWRLALIATSFLNKLHTTDHVTTVRHIYTYWVYSLFSPDTNISTMKLNYSIAKNYQQKTRINRI